MDNPKPPGAGSIWNPNSWHWEEKDYTSIAKTLIESKIASLTFSKDGIAITHTCKSVKGDAQVNIRKGK
jgi:activator of HSP90 ATPase